jgi:N-acetylglucosaminyl-diphospho-decaprenol L-rhamnosyltransferase
MQEAPTPEPGARSPEPAPPNPEPGARSLEPEPPSVSILIVSWNARDWLARCLHSLMATPHQVVVVDNGSADGSVELVRQTFPSAHLVASTENLGFAGGVNRARQAASGSALLVLNPDVEASSQAIDRLAEVLRLSPATAATGPIGAVAARLVDADGTPQAGFNVRRFPTLASLACDLLLVDHVWPSNPASQRYYARDLDPDSPADVDQPAAACLMIRAEAFDRIGGMDERFHPAWFEDVDFCLRLHGAGYRIRYEPAATVVHRGGVARDALGPHGFSRAFYRNMLRYVRKHYGPGATLVVRGMMAAGMAPRAAVAAIGRDMTSVKACAGVARDAFSWRDE